MKTSLTPEQKEQLRALIHETIIPAIREDVLGDYDDENEDAMMDLFYEATQFIRNNI